jgi:hypothetical protein
MRSVEEALISLIEDMGRIADAVTRMTPYIESDTAAEQVGHDMEGAADLLCSARAALEHSLSRVREAHAETEAAAAKKREIDRTMALGQEIGRNAEARAAAASLHKSKDTDKTTPGMVERLVPRTAGKQAS